MAEAIIAQQGTADVWCRVHAVEPAHDTLVFSLAPRSIADPRFSTLALPRELIAGAPTWIELVSQISSGLPNGEMTLVIEFDSRKQSIRRVAEFVLDLIDSFRSKLNVIVLTDTDLPEELHAVAVATKLKGQVTALPESVRNDDPLLQYLLCAVALESGIAVQEVSTAVLRRKMEPLVDRLHERWPWRIRIYTLGAFKLVKDGQTKEFAGKAQRRPLDLLKVLIAYGGKSVDVNVVMDALWPDSQGDAAQKLFDTTLHRLRKLLADDAVTLVNQRVSLNPKMCWVDIWEFEQLATVPVRSEGPDDDGAEGRDIDAVIDRIFQLYGGDFLCFEEEQQWIFSPAEKFKGQFIRFVRMSGDLLEQQGKWSRAIEVYRRGIEVDNLSEDLYRALMESQRRGGSVADALETYRRCRHMLSVLLSIAPSERTTALYRQLTEQSQARFDD
jgi:DNA-binding SARP family transcriptional activator